MNIIQSLPLELTETIISLCTCSHFTTHQERYKKVVSDIIRRVERYDEEDHVVSDDEEEELGAYRLQTEKNRKTSAVRSFVFFRRGWYLFSWTLLRKKSINYLCTIDHDLTARKNLKRTLEDH
jgi:vacuolar-type H+-ATPase subunit I/STV1